MKQKEYKECPFCHRSIVCNIGGHYKEHVRSCQGKVIIDSLIDKKLLDINISSSKWVKVYNAIIEKRKNNLLLTGYRERHHILPKSLGGTNNPDNLIYLTAKEHYICHMLLVEIFRDVDRKSFYKMLNAFTMMKTREGQEIRMSSSLYEKYRIELSEIKKNTGKGVNNNNYGKIWVSNKELKSYKVIKKEEFEKYQREGWFKGRVTDWDYYEMKQNLTTHQVYEKQRQLRDKNYKQNKIIRSRKEQLEFMSKEFERKKAIYQRYYEIYLETPRWKEFIEKTGYQSSRPCLVAQFKRYFGDDFKRKR